AERQLLSAFHHHVERCAFDVLEDEERCGLVFHPAVEDAADEWARDAREDASFAAETLDDLGVAPVHAAEHLHRDEGAAVREVACVPHLAEATAADAGYELPPIGERRRHEASIRRI